MSEIDFKELKEKLTSFDKGAIDKVLIQALDRDLKVFSCVANIVSNQHSKDTETIKELLEIISFQQEVFERIKTYVKPHRDGLDGRFEETKATIESCVAITETITRLQKLMESK